jgi:hypothetical protein
VAHLDVKLQLQIPFVEQQTESGIDQQGQGKMRGFGEGRGSGYGFGTSSTSLPLRLDIMRVSFLWKVALLSCRGELSSDMVPVV